MLPVPFKKYVPKLFKDDPKTDTLSNKADVHLTLWKNDVLGMKRFVRADECDASHVSELGFLLRAGIKENDSDLVKRGKVINAIPNHKKRGLWTNELKTIIDAVTGYSAVFYVEANRSDWIMVGESYQATDYVGSLGVDAVPDLNLGLHLYGSADEESEAGNIFINLHNGTTTAVLTYVQVKAVYEAINDYIQFSYLRIFIGYVNSSGQFIKYDLMPVQTITASGALPIFKFINGEFWIISGNTAKVYAIEAGTLLHTINLATGIGMSFLNGAVELMGNSLVILGNYWMTEVDVLTYTVIKSAYLRTSNYFTRGISNLGGFVFVLDGGWTIHKVDVGNARKVKSWDFNAIYNDVAATITSDGYYLYLATYYDYGSLLSKIIKLDLDLNIVATYYPLIHPSMFFWKEGKLYFGNLSATAPQYGIFDPATETFEYNTIDYSVEFMTFNISQAGEMFVLRHYTTPRAILKYGKKFVRQRVSGETPSGVGTVTNGYTAQLEVYEDFIAIASSTNNCLVLKNFSSIIGDPT